MCINQISREVSKGVLLVHEEQQNKQYRIPLRSISAREYQRMKRENCRLSEESGAASAVLRARGFAGFGVLRGGRFTRSESVNQVYEE